MTTVTLRLLQFSLEIWDDNKMASSLRLASHRLPCMTSKRTARMFATAGSAETSLHRPSKDGKP